MPRKLSDPHPCLCGQFGVGNVTTGCNARTRRTYAPGHDARLAGLLIWAGNENREVSWNSGGILHTGDALTMATNHLSPRLAAKVLAAFDRKRPAEDDLAERQAAYAAELRRPTPKPTTTIKVGRWTYELTDNGDGTATYTKRNGEVHTVNSAPYFD